LKVAFRVDAGTAMGGGHLSRCLTIANELIKHSVTQCYFLLKSHEGNFAPMIKKNGFEVHILPLEYTPDYNFGDYSQWVGGSVVNDANGSLLYMKEKGFKDKDWLIVDHYGLDSVFEKLISKSGFNVGVIDDLANRTHNCKFLIDQTCGRQKIEYIGLVNRDAIIMAGQSYCMLRPEFLTARVKAVKKRSHFASIKNILLNFGSTDPTNITSKIIDVLSHIDFKFEVDIVVVVGSNTPYLTLIRKLIADYSGNISLIVDANNMSELIYHADLAIGAAGATSWERCALGLPTIIIKTADNQSTVVSRIIGFGVAILHDINVPDQTNELLNHFKYIHDNYAEMSAKCSSLVHADGVNKVVEEMLGISAK